MPESGAGRLHWADLATPDDDVARAFYTSLFGWTAHDETVGHGRLTRFCIGDRPVCSMYRLRRRHLDAGVPPHWTPYVTVEDVDRAAERASTLGGSVIVAPLAAHDARISVITDPCGAVVGLWGSR